MQSRASFRSNGMWLNRVLIAALLLWLTALLILPSNPLDRLPGRDNGVFLYGGQQILLGKIPYLDFWDHKGPLIHYINALGLYLGNGYRWGVWGIEFIFLALTGFGVYKILKINRGTVSGLIGLGSWAFATHSIGPYHFGDSNFTETYSNLFNVLVLLCWVKTRQQVKAKRYFVWIGLLGGASLLLRPNSLGVVIAVILVEIIQGIFCKTTRATVNDTSLILIGCAVFPILFALFFYRAGALPSVIDAVFRYNLIYARSGVSVISDFIIIRGTQIFALLGGLAYVIAIAFLARIVSDIKNQLPVGTFSLLLLLGVPLEMGLISLSGRVYPHYLISLFPYFGLLMGFAVSVIISRFHFNRGNAPATVLAFASLASLIAFSLPSQKEYLDIAQRLLLEREKGIEAPSVLVRYVRENSFTGDTVLVWGNDVWINFLSDRPSPSKYSFQYPLFMQGYSKPEHVVGFLRELQENPPRLIVGVKEVDRKEILPLPILLNQPGGLESPDLPAELADVFIFIRDHYCVRAVLKDAVIYGLPSDPGVDPPRVRDRLFRLGLMSALRENKTRGKCSRDF